MPLLLATAELIGTLLEAICYGTYFVVSLELFRLFYMRLQAGRRILYLLIIAVVVFFLTTTHLVLQINRIVHAFSDHMDVPGATLTFFTNLSVQSRTAKTAIYMTLTVVCDALFVYRVFAVYQRKYISIIVPSILFLADTALSAWSIWTVTQISSSLSAVQGVVKGFNYFYAVTLTLNFLCTVMISWKIWAIHRSVSEPAVAGVRFMGIVAVVVESAAVYSCFLIALIATSAQETTGLWVILDPLCPIIGMVFSAVMVRASREYHYDTFMADDSSLPTYHPPDHSTFSRSRGMDSGDAGDTAVGHTAQVPSAARKRGSLTFHIPSSPRQASYVDLTEKEHRAPEERV